jgi:large subunit ribosomal protein L23
MAIFSQKNESVATTQKKSLASSALATDYNVDGVILKPYLTEKSVMQGDNQVYTFVVAKSATKHSVKKAIIAIYNVTPVKVNIVNKLHRKSMSRAKGRMVSEKGIKKAYVYLKTGDTITLV